MSWHTTLHEYVDFLKQKHGLSHNEVLEELSSQRVPAGIYSGELTPLQATATYLYTQGESHESIAQQLARPQRDIHKLIHEQNKTGPAQGPEISVRVFKDKTLSAGEHLVEELQKQGKTVAEIAQILSKSEQTIWTQHYRIQAKRGESNE